MQPRPSFDRTLLIPIAIGVVSILGMGWIFLRSGLAKSLIPSTATPSIFSSPDLATWTPSPIATSTQEETPPTATGTPLDTYPEPLAEKLLPTSTWTPESLPSPTTTPTPENIQPLAAGKYYDDVDPNIAYDAYWTGLKNANTADSYHGTIHVSNSIGDEASFRFTGKRFRLGYKRGRSFGTVRVIVDDQSYSFHEDAFDLVWSSPELSPGDHFVRIIHDSGESINLDYVLIVD